MREDKETNASSEREKSKREEKENGMRERKGSNLREEREKKGRGSNGMKKEEREKGEKGGGGAMLEGRKKEANVVREIVKFREGMKKKSLFIMEREGEREKERAEE